MKKRIILSAIVCFTLSSFLCKAQEVTATEASSEKTYNNGIYINPGPFFANTFQFGYERIFNNKNNKTGLLISPRITYRENSSLLLWGIGSDLQYRVYLSGPNAAAYFSPFFTGDYIESKDYYSCYYCWPPYYDTTTYITRSFAGGVLFGLKVIIAKRFLLDIYAGGGLRISNTPSSTSYYPGIIIRRGGYNGVFGPGYSGIMLKAGVQFGINF